MDFLVGNKTWLIVRSLEFYTLWIIVIFDLLSFSALVRQKRGINKIMIGLSEAKLLLVKSVFRCNATPPRLLNLQL